MATYQILTNMVRPENGGMEATQIIADKTLASDNGDFVEFWAGSEMVAAVATRHIVYVKRI